MSASDPGIAPVPYVLFPGSARSALERYRDVFGGELTLHTFSQFGRTDGPATAIAHGVLEGPVRLFGADGGDEGSRLRVEGLLLSLLGAATPDVLHRWFDGLAEGGEIVDPLQRRPWGATDGQVRDPFGLTWLIGYEPAES